MKNIKKFERYNEVERKVYWISTFGNDFEDSLVRLVSQYKGAKDDFEGIENIDYALGKANSARENLTENDFIIITMEFGIKDEKVTWSPEFYLYNISDEDYLKRNKYIFVGFAPNTNKEKYELYQKTKKYNL